jgi:putative ABC transport system permease protein
MGLWAYALRELVRQPGRGFLVVCGIAVGVAAAVAAWCAIRTARGGYSEFFDSIAGGAALEVYSPGEVGFDPGPAEPLRHVAGIRAVLPEVQGTAARPGWDGPVPVVVRGKSPGESGAVPGAGEAFVPAALLDAARLKPRERLRLWGPAGQVDLVALPSPSGTAGVAGGNAVTVSLPTARHLFGLGNKVNLVRLVLAEGADPGGVEAAVATRLPPGLSVRRPAGRADVARGLRAVAEDGLTGLAAVAVAGAAYVVFGIAQWHLLTRRREVAILRSLGASAGQVGGLFARQAVILGLAGGLLGSACGFSLAWVVTDGAAAATGLAIAGPRLGWEVFPLGVGLGLASSVAAVWLPARSLCRCSAVELFRPAAAARGRAAASPETGPWAAYCFCTGLWVLDECATGSLSPAWGQALFPPALALAVVGTAGLVSPWLPRFLSWLEGPVNLAFGVCGVLAIRQLGRRPDRTARTSGVVLVTAMMAVGFGHSVLNTLADVRTWVERAIPADFLVRGSAPDPGFVFTAAVPQSLGDDIRRLGAVQSVERIAFLPTKVDGTAALVLARTFAPDRPLPLDIREAEAGEVRRALARGEAVLADGLAHSLRVGPGGTVAVETPRGPRQLRVAGTVTEYAAGGAALYLDWETARALFGAFDVHVFLVAAEPGRRAEANGRLAAFCRSRGLLLQSNQELRRHVGDVTRGLAASLWVVLVVMFVVAGLGVASAVAVAACEQSRDGEVLRAVGAGPGRIRRVVRRQAVALTVAGLPGGVLCGIGLALVLNESVRGLWGYAVPFRVEWHFLIGVVSVALLAGLACGRRA